MSKAKVVRFIIFLITLLCAVWQAASENVEAELIMLFMSYINYKALEEEDE